MEYYQFKDGVFLVQGKVNGCIYDLNKKELYAIDRVMKDALIALINDQHVVSEDFLPVIEELEEMGLLERSQIKGVIRDIRELADPQQTWRLVWIEVTKQCNLKCKHCYQESSPHAEGEMAWEDFVRVIDELKKNDVKQIRFIGGEPLLPNGKLKKMIEYAAEHIKYIEVFTNGTLIDESWIEVFQQHHVTVRLSLYSIDAENHENVTCVKGSHAKTYHALQLLKEHGVNTTITSVLMKDLDLHGLQHDSNFNHLDMVRMSGRASLRLLDKQLVARRLCVLKTFQHPLNVKQVKDGLHRNSCFGYKLYIDTDLNVYPCSMERKMIHGNIREQALHDVLKNEILFLNKDHIAECKDCEFRYACLDCRPDRLDDNLYGKPWWCTYLPWEGRWQDPEQFMADLHLEA